MTNQEQLPGNIETFGDLESFYHANPARLASPEADYGVHWRLDGWDGVWRVSYVRNTGEVYAVFQGHYSAGTLPTGETFVSTGQGKGPVFVLGTFPVDPEAGPTDVYYRGLDRFLKGWTDHCGPENGLAWLIGKMAQAGQAQVASNRPLRERENAPNTAVLHVPGRRAGD